MAVSLPGLLASCITVSVRLSGSSREPLTFRCVRNAVRWGYQ